MPKTTDIKYVQVTVRFGKAAPQFQIRADERIKITAKEAKYGSDSTIDGTLDLLREVLSKIISEWPQSPSMKLCIDKDNKNKEIREKGECMG